MVNVLAGMQHVQNGFKEGQQRGELNRFRSLTEGAMGGDPNAIEQQYALDPQRAAQVQSGADITAKRARGAAKYLMEAVETGDPAQIQGRYNAVRPFLAKVGQQAGKVPPEQFDPTMVEGMQQLLAKTAYLDQGSTGNTVQSRFVAEDGRVMMVMRDGSLVDSGEKADRQMWFRDHPGMPPELIGKDGMVRPVGQQPMQAPQMQQPGPQSGTPFTIDPSLPPEVQASIRNNEMAWAQAPDGANMPVQGQSALRPPAPQQQAPQPQGESLDHIPRMSTYTGQALARPSEAQVAAETEAARQAAQLATLPLRQDIETQGALARARGEAAIKNDAEIGIANTKRSREANDTLSLLQQAERLIPVSTGSGVGAVRDRAAAMVGQTTEGANAIAALKTLSGQLVSKMPRMEGPQSDRDVQMYKDMAGNLADADVPREQRLAALNMIRVLNERYSGGNDLQTTGAVVPGGLSPGHEEDGYRFRGGDPADPANWERL